MTRLLVGGCFLLLHFISEAPVSSNHECKRVCERDALPMLCEYNFTVEWYRTLSKACWECPFNQTDCFRPECVSGDGRVKPLITVNRQVPGPSIEVCEGDTVIVWVYNDMEDGEATSIHWHGIHQKGTPYFDGVGQITQCNIGMKERFRYEFKASPAGTHWYHGHTGMQLADGLFGAIIVRQPSGMDPNSALYNVDDHVMLIGDWLPVSSMTRYVDLMHDLYDALLPQGLHVNGRARNVDVPNKYKMVNTNKTSAKTPMAVFEVMYGERYRFRVIGSSGNCPVQVAVENHQLQVLANDGVPVRPRPVDVFILFPGERYDFLLVADKPVANYWIRIIGLGDCRSVMETTTAILRYKGANSTDPTTDPMFSTQEKIMLNAVLMDEGYWSDVYGLNHTVIQPHELRYGGKRVNLTNQVVDQKLYLAMDFYNNDNTKYNNKHLYPVSSLPPRKDHYTPVFDNITFNLPPIPLMSQHEDVDESWFCNRSTLTNTDKCLQDLCLCTHVLRFQTDQMIELIVINEARRFQEPGHPMHLHGHSFYILGMGKMFKSTTRDEIMRLDEAGNLTRNYINPPLRDTVNIPDAGYAILRFKADNPGYWFFHCHTDSHLAQGKALLIKIGDYDEFPPVPSTFPKCGGWGFSNAKRRMHPCETATNESAGRTVTCLYTLTCLLCLAAFYCVPLIV